MIKKQDLDSMLNRNDVIQNFPWIAEKERLFITSADYDGLICAVYLHHVLNWQLAGFYDLSTIWISDAGIHDRKDLIWVDLNILPKQGKAIGGHIISIDGEHPSGFETSCNPNIMLKLTSDNFQNKYPFSTLLFLFWLHGYSPKLNDLSKMLILQSDASWLKFQTYPENSKKWMNILSDYPWDQLFHQLNTKRFEGNVHNKLYPRLIETGAMMNRGKIPGKFNNRSSYQIQVNPDWDTDVIYRLFTLIGNATGWTPPKIPRFEKVIEGKRHKIALASVVRRGLNAFLKENKVFSYAITSPKILNFTSFGSSKTPVTK